MIENLTSQEHKLYKEYQEKAVSNIEVFRNEARVLHRRYTLPRRRFVKRLESSGGKAYEILTVWRDELYPVLAKLDETRESKAFHKSVIKYLQVADDDSQSAVNHVVNLRVQQVNDQFIKVFNKVLSKKVAHELLDMNPREISATTDQYIRSTLINIVAKEYGIAFMDPHSSLLRRLLTARKIRRERKKLRLRDKKRVNEIGVRLSEIEVMDNRLIGEIMAMRIDLVPTLAARANYEKRIAQMAKDDIVDASARLEVFSEETRAIRNDMMSNTPGSLDMSLESVYVATNSADKLLLRIFDLTNTQKNNLLVLTKEHRELREERDMILQSQKERLAKQE